jgi:hypothetical protein
MLETHGNTVNTYNGTAVWLPCSLTVALSFHVNRTSMSLFHHYKQCWPKPYWPCRFFHILNYFLRKHLGQRFWVCLCDDTFCQTAFCTFLDWLTQLPTMWVTQLDHTVLAPRIITQKCFRSPNVCVGGGVMLLSIFSRTKGGEYFAYGHILVFFPTYNFLVHILFAHSIFFFFWRASVLSFFLWWRQLQCLISHCVPDASHTAFSVTLCDSGLQL